MPVHIDRLTSEVTPETEHGSSGGAGRGGEGSPWDELDRVRQAQARLIRDLRRTSAEGFDD